MGIELKKRIFTSFILLVLLFLMITYTYILIISLIMIAIVSWIEFYALISKIFLKNNFKERFLRFLYKAISLLYLAALVFTILIIESNNHDMRIFIFYSILVSILSDIGGLITGRIFRGKKLSKISPKKTISGSIGSFIFSLYLIPFFVQYFTNYSFLSIIIITIFISFISQIGDLFISFIKRKAKVKDTSDLLPGHGGFLDRIDGIIFALPSGLILFKLF